MYQIEVPTDKFIILMKNPRFPQLHGLYITVLLMPARLFDPALLFGTHHFYLVHWSTSDIAEMIVFNSFLKNQAKNRLILLHSV